MAAHKKPSAKKKAPKKASSKKKATAKPARKKAPARTKPATKKAATKKKAPAKKKAPTKKKTAPVATKKTPEAKAKPAKAKTQAKTKKAPPKSRAAKPKTAAKSPAPAPHEPPTPGRAVLAFRDSDERTRLGKKWTCFGCGGRFYDLGRSPAICPKCGANQSQRPKETASSPPPAPAPRRVARPMAPLLEEDDDAVRYDEEFDLGIQDSDEDETGADASLFPEGPEAEEEEPEED